MSMRPKPGAPPSVKCDGISIYLIASIIIVLAGGVLVKPGHALESVCQCITHGGTRGHEWGAVAVASNQARMNGSDCLVIYIRAAPDEIIELRFYEIILRTGCTDSIQIHPHLRDSIISETARNDDIICAENAAKYISNRHPSAIDQHWADTNSIDWPRPTTKSSDGSHRAMADTGSNANPTPIVPKDDDELRRPMPMNKLSILSSGNVMAIHLKYGRIEDARLEYFRASADFRFLKKSLFEVDGNLVPTTLCDYQFLPHPINVARADIAANVGQGASWRYFYSPRYPAHYAGHMKCAYKFIGRCTSASDRLTVYDSRTADKTTIIDVLCNTKAHKKITSTGPMLLIEFESRSGRTSMGFSAKYRFTDAHDSVRRTENSPTDHLPDDASTHLRRPPHPAAANTVGPLLLISSTVHSGHHRIAWPAPTTTVSSHTSTATTTNVPQQRQQQQPIFKEPSEMMVENINTSHPPPAGVAVMNTSESSNNNNGRVAADPLLCPPATNCDVVLMSALTKNGTVMSPMYPGPYSPKTVCRFEFRGTGKERIQIKFTDFTLPSDGDGDDCDQADTLKILMPSKNKFEPVDVLCGNTLPKPIMSNGPKMMLEFRGRNSGKGNRGFKAEYVFLENYGIISGRQLPDQECSFEFNSSEAPSGWFHSPNFPGNYPRNIECNYLFHGNPMEKVSIRFTYFDVEGIFPCDEDTSSDTVEFSNFDSRDRKFPIYCEKKDNDFSVRSDGRFFRVTFRSNDRLDGTGFRASYVFESIPSTTDSVLMAMNNHNIKANAPKRHLRSGATHTMLDVHLSISCLFVIQLIRIVVSSPGGAAAATGLPSLRWSHYLKL